MSHAARENSADAERFDLTRWMPGLAPGDLVASELNPRAWPVEDGR